MAEILLIEDDAIVQHAHKLIFNKLGFKVDLAESGYVALNMLKNKPSYNIIFVDLGLPDINGLDLIEEIRSKHSKNNNLVIIVLTGYIGEREKKACLKAGANNVIHKPILANKMLEVLNPYLSRCE